MIASHGKSKTLGFHHSISFQRESWKLQTWSSILMLIIKYFARSFFNILPRVVIAHHCLFTCKWQGHVKLLRLCHPHYLHIFCYFSLNINGADHAVTATKTRLCVKCFVTHSGTSTQKWMLVLLPFFFVWLFVFHHMEGWLSLLPGHLPGGLDLELPPCMMTMRQTVGGLTGIGRRMGGSAGSVETRGTCQHLGMRSQGGSLGAVWLWGHTGLGRWSGLARISQQTIRDTSSSVFVLRPAHLGQLRRPVWTNTCSASVMETQDMP